MTITFLSSLILMSPGWSSCVYRNDTSLRCLIRNEDLVFWCSHASVWGEIHDFWFHPPQHCKSRFVRCDAHFCLTYSNSLMRSPVPGYPIRLRLPELSSLALTNQFTPSPSTRNLPAIISTNQKLYLVMTKCYQVGNLSLCLYFLSVSNLL